MPSPAPKPSVQDSDSGAPEPSPSIALTAPRGDEPKLAAWTLTSWNRRVLKDWEALCRDTPEDAARCYAWLSTDAVKRILAAALNSRGMYIWGIGATKSAAGTAFITKFCRRPSLLSSGTQVPTQRAASRLHRKVSSVSTRSARILIDQNICSAICFNIR